MAQKGPELVTRGKERLTYWFSWMKINIINGSIVTRKLVQNFAGHCVPNVDKAEKKKNYLFEKFIMCEVT